MLAKKKKNLVWDYSFSSSGLAEVGDTEESSDSNSSICWSSC